MQARTLFRNVRNSAAALSGALLLTTTLPCTAGTEVAAADDALVIYSAGLDELLSSPKDAALRDALRMLDDRILELPQELGEPEMPAELIAMFLEMASSPMTLQFGILPDLDMERDQRPPVYGRLVVWADQPETASRQADAIAELLSQAGPGFVLEPDPEHPGLMQFDMDIMPAWMGTSEVDERPAFVMSFNELESFEVDVNGLAAGLDLPDGATTSFALRYDGQQLQPLIEMFMQQMPPQDAASLRHQLRMSGIYGEAPLSVDMAAGTAGDFAFTVARQANYTANQASQILLSDERLSADDLAILPPGVTAAQVARVNLSAMPDYLKLMFDPMQEQMQGQGMAMQDPLQMANQMLGIDLEADLFDHLGTLSGWYLSTESGGGGLLSAVSFAEVDDPAAVQRSINRINQRLTEMAGGMARGYVRLDQRQFRDVNMTVMTFPGIPVPMQLSYAVSDGMLWASLSPQGVISAVEHYRTRENSIVDNPSFLHVAGMMEQQVNLDAHPPISVQYVDTAHFARSGYGLLTLGVSSLNNALQSPSDTERYPGLILPPYGEFTDGIKSYFCVTYTDGDDMVVRCLSDPSALVNLAAVGGFFSDSMGSGFLLAGGIAGAMTGIEESQRAMARAAGGDAQQTQSLGQLRQLGMAVVIFADENDGRMPAGLQELVDNNYITSRTIDSPVGEAPDGAGDYWLNTTISSLDDVEQPDRTILGYDRAAFANANTVGVLFADGHVESMNHGELLELTAAKQHEGVDFNIPGF